MAALLVLLIGAPLVVRAVPPRDSDVTAAALLRQVEESGDVGYSGYVETLGTLQLPIADRFTDVGQLFGERTRMRVWWRDADTWRVDKLQATGETDLFHNAGRTTEWSYEGDRADLAYDPDIRLPRSADILPPELARRLLEDASPDEVERLPVRRVAGRGAPGLRLSPSAPQSSIDHVDLWADPDTGLPLAVEVVATGATSPALTSTFMDISTEVPDESLTTFTLPPGAMFHVENTLDVADAANKYAPFRPPASLAGLKRSASPQRAVGVYGSGTATLLAVPLWDDAAEPLREQLRLTPGIRMMRRGDLLTVGPLSVMLTTFVDYDGGWLLAGTVTRQTLVRAAQQIHIRSATLDRPPD